MSVHMVLVFEDARPSNGASELTAAAAAATATTTTAATPTATEAKNHSLHPCQGEVLCGTLVRGFSWDMQF